MLGGLRRHAPAGWLYSVRVINFWDWATSIVWAASWLSVAKTLNHGPESAAILANCHRIHVGLTTDSLILPAISVGQDHPRKSPRLVPCLTGLPNTVCCKC